MNIKKIVQGTLRQSKVNKQKIMRSALRHSKVNLRKGALRQSKINTYEKYRVQHLKAVESEQLKKRLGHLNPFRTAPTFLGTKDLELVYSSFCAIFAVAIGLWQQKASIQKYHRVGQTPSGSRKCTLRRVIRAAHSWGASTSLVQREHRARVSPPTTLSDEPPPRLCRLRSPWKTIGGAGASKEAISSREQKPRHNQLIESLDQNIFSIPGTRYQVPSTFLLLCLLAIVQCAPLASTPITHTHPPKHVPIIMLAI